MYFWICKLFWNLDCQKQTLAAFFLFVACCFIFFSLRFYDLFPTTNLHCRINYRFRANVPHFACNKWHYDHRWTSRFMSFGGSERHPFTLREVLGWDGMGWVIVSKDKKGQKTKKSFSVFMSRQFCNVLLLLLKWNIIKHSITGL